MSEYRCSVCSDDVWMCRKCAEVDALSLANSSVSIKDKQLAERTRVMREVATGIEEMSDIIHRCGCNESNGDGCGDCAGARQERERIVAAIRTWATALRIEGGTL